MMAAAGLSELLRGGRKAGPAGLRGLLKSPPHLAGQASAPLRGSPVNPCRGRLGGGHATLDLAFQGMKPPGILMQEPASCLHRKKDVL